MGDHYNQYSNLAPEQRAAEERIWVIPCWTGESSVASSCQQASSRLGDELLSVRVLIQLIDLPNQGENSECQCKHVAVQREPPPQESRQSRTRGLLTYELHGEEKLNWAIPSQCYGRCKIFIVIDFGTARIKIDKCRTSTYTKSHTSFQVTHIEL